jgi:hypothetical protein
MYLRVALMLGGLLVAAVATEIGLRAYSLLMDRPPEDFQSSLESSQGVEQRSSTDGNNLQGLVQPSDHPDQVYDLRPHLDCVFMGARVWTNPIGMRDREYEVTKPPTTLRVVGLGDSVTFGWGVDEDQTFLRATERIMNDRFGPAPKFEVMNFGVPGYNTVMEVASFKNKAAEFSPDAVILQFTNNDYDLPRFMYSPPDYWALDRLWLLELTTKGYRGLMESHRTWVSPSDLPRLPKPDRARVNHRYRHMVGADAFRRALEELASITAGIPVFFVVLQEHSAPWNHAVPIARKLGFHVVVVGPYHLKYIESNGIEPTDEGYIRTFWRSKRDPHPNALSHSLHAKAIVEAIEKNGPFWIAQTDEN